MRRLVGLALLLSCAHVRPVVHAERGQFTLHKFLAPIGEERWSIERDRDAFVLHSDFLFTDRGQKVPLAVTMRLREDGTPLATEIKGRVARHNSIERRLDAIAEGAFPIAAYAPVSVQMLLVRYWRARGEPAEIATPWNQRIAIARCGTDTVAGEALECHRISGLIWGDEWLWTDAKGGVAALVSIDAEFDRFEAMRPDLEPHLRTFVARAAADGMQHLAQLAERLSPKAAVLAIVGARVWDGTGRTLTDATIVTDGDRILAVGPRAEIQIPAGAQIVDGKGGTVIPGLWDTHAHFEQVEWGPIYLAAGVTSVRDCGNEFDFITAVRDAIESGRGLGPRMVLAGIVDGDGPTALGVDRIHGPADIEPMVERYARAGFAQMKIYSSIPPALVPAIARAAHARGMTVTGHVPDGMTASEGVRAGMDMINHWGFVLTEALPPEDRKKKQLALVEAVLNADFDSPRVRSFIRELAEHKTVIEPTLALGELGVLRPEEKRRIEPGIAKLPPSLRDAIPDSDAPAEAQPRIELARKKSHALLTRLLHAGVPILAGTDQAVPGHSLHREMEIFVEAGFTPEQALQSATVVPARLFGRDGTIEPGKKADLVLVDGNPLADIRDSRRIRAVVSRGRLFDPAPLWRSVGFEP